MKIHVLNFFIFFSFLISFFDASAQYKGSEFKCLAYFNKIQDTTICVTIDGKEYGTPVSKETFITHPELICSKINCIVTSYIFSCTLKDGTYFEITCADNKLNSKILEVISTMESGKRVYFENIKIKKTAENLEGNFGSITYYIE